MQTFLLITIVTVLLVGNAHAAGTQEEKKASVRGLRQQWKPVQQTKPLPQASRSLTGTVCTDESRVECHCSEKMISVCHYDVDQDLYKTLCVAEFAAAGLLETYEDDYCGECVSCGPEIDCDDSNICTADEAVCGADGEWTCDYTDVVSCAEGSSCDPFDGVCKEDDQVVPCVAVIDEDDNISGQQYTLWESFRATYPYRPFCLLVPTPAGYYSLTPPTNFLSDPYTTFHDNLNRDNGSTSLAEDWVTMCGLDVYSSANVGWVGLFVDDSGSMYKSDVQASYDKFVADLLTQGIAVKEVVNGVENWIEPFMTTLVPET